MSDQLPSPCPMPSNVKQTLLMVLLSFQDDYGKHRFIAEAQAWVRAQPVGEAAPPGVVYAKELQAGAAKPKRPDLTPSDLRDEGIVIEEANPNYFRWVDTDEANYRAGALHDTPAQAIANARKVFGIPEADDNPATLGNAWPDMPDLPDGVDRFAQHPVAGEPPAQGEQAGA